MTAWMDGVADPRVGQEPEHRTSEAGQPLDDLMVDAVLAFPERADCCSASPRVRVILPPAPGRPERTELHFCGHHHRAAQSALDAAGARAVDRGNRLVSSAL